MGRRLGSNQRLLAMQSPHIMNIIFAVGGELNEALRVGRPEGSVALIVLAFAKALSCFLRVPQIRVQIEGCASPSVGWGAIASHEI